MSHTFKHIVDIELLHSYFNNGRFISVSFALAPASKIMLRNMGLLLKPLKGGISIFASNGDLLESSATDDLPIRIYLYSQDPNFVNYTELKDFTPMRDVLYFNNLPKGQFLPEGAIVGGEHSIPWSSNIVKLPSFDAGKHYEFRDVGYRKIPSECIQKHPNGDGEFIISNYQEGKIAVYEETIKVYEVYYKPEETWKKPLAVLEIFPSKLSEYFMGETKKDLLIAFQNRKTYWKYFLVDPVYQKFKNLQIVNEEKEAVFSFPIVTDIFGKKALVFESLETIPLQENPKTQLKLINVDESGPQDIIRLPIASPNSIYQDNPTSKEAMYSHIYV